MTTSVQSRNVVVLVEGDGTVLAAEDKLRAHQPPGRLHLAFSVVLFRRDGAVLLQQRAATKYHFPLYWANACCSHPAPGEAIADSAHRRVEEELGVSCALEPAGVFVYRAVCPTSELVEHELDHVFVGELDAAISFDPDEVERVAWIDPSRVDELDGPIAPWLTEALELALAYRRGKR